MFQDKLPRVFPDIEELLQLYRDMIIGDRFHLKEHIIIRVYGFVHEPYSLCAFLTPRIFALEYIIQTNIVENEHFLNFRKGLEIKFPLKVGPFIVNNKYTLPVIEGFLQYMNL